MSTDCPQCPHPASEHGTYGCLYGWERARYSERILHGCHCSQRDVQEKEQQLAELS